MKKFKVGVSDYVRAPFDVELKAFPEADFLFLDAEEEDGFEEDVLRKLDALIVWHARVGRRTAALLSKHAIVVRYGVGFDSVDVAALTEAGIPFCNTPDYGTEEVADTACTMILEMQRKVVSYDRAARHFTDGWQENVQRPLRRTSSQTLGIVGVGRIGTAVMNRMRSFGFRLLGYDPYQPAGHEKAIGYERRAEIQDLLSESDIVSIHCPLDCKTAGMLDDGFFTAMKEGAALVNTARGGLFLDLDCLDRHLRSGRLRGAALDVLPIEPPLDHHSLIHAWKTEQPWIRGRLIINPHTSYYSEEALYEMRFKASETARLYLKAGVLRNQII